MAFIAAPVAAWAIGAGASATVAAVAGSVAVGVVSGAVIGAATAAISGGDIFKGALKGAVIGGITGGALSGLGMATGIASAETQLAKFGLDSAGTAISTAPTAGIPELATEGGTALRSAGETPGILAQAGKPLLSDETVKVVAGVGQGAAEGYGETKAAEAEVAGQKELAEWQRQQDRIDVAANVPGEFQARTANIKVPEWWNKYLNPKQGVLTQGVA